MKSLKRLATWLIRNFGTEISDARTGGKLGRAIVTGWGGHPWLVGLHRPYVRAVFLPQKTNRYARARLGFATHAPVDFARLEEREATVCAASPAPDVVLWAILVHGSADEAANLLRDWRKAGYREENLLLVHGGRQEDFEQIAHSQKVYVPDAALRTRRHPVEKQSYAGPLRETARWLQNRNFSHICLVEYDHLPLVPDWDRRLQDRLDSENADVLFAHLERVDETNAPHYLYHLSDPGFSGAWRSFSRREDPAVVLNAMATGSFWTRAAFEAVAATPEPLPIYLEMYLPTTAHHLGFRVRDLGGQSAFIHFDPVSSEFVRSARNRGAWSVHPVKERKG